MPTLPFLPQASPLPRVAAPLPIEIEPLVPELLVPELNTNTPLTPVAPAFALLIVIEPLVLAIPAPVVIPTAPPVCTVLCPDVTVNACVKTALRLQGIKTGIRILRHSETH